MQGVPNVVQQLDALSTEQLEQMLTDKDAFTKFVTQRISDMPVRMLGCM
jgi:hypothetical protein